MSRCRIILLLEALETVPYRISNSEGLPSTHTRLLYSGADRVSRCRIILLLEALETH